MKKITREQVLVGMTTALRLLIGFLFLQASFDKILAPAKFAQVIYNYHVLPVELVNLCAIFMPWFEAFIGIALIFGIWVETVSLLMSLLTAGFTLLIISAIVRGLNIECGCFSLDEQGSLVGWKRVVEDLFIVAAGIIIFVSNIQQQKTNARPE